MHSSVRVDVLCVEDSHGCHVVVGVGRVRATSARKHNVPNTEFSLLYFQSNCVLVIRLYVVIVNSFLLPFTAHFCTAKTSHLRCCVYSKAVSLLPRPWLSALASSVVRNWEQSTDDAVSSNSGKQEKK